MARDSFAAEVVGAVPAGIPPRTLQDFLATHTWDHERAIDSLQHHVAERFHDDHAVGVMDETSLPRDGDRTAAVQQQYCGATGKIDNCVMTVHLGYVLPSPPRSL